MGYFEHFNAIQYNGLETINIMNSVLARYKPFNDSSLYYYYTLLDGEKAEDVSFSIYETSQYWWILLAVNNVIDPYHDWMMSQNELESFMASKYGDDLYSAHHFINVTNDSRMEDGYNSSKWQELIDTDQELPVHIQPISNRDYEIAKNDEKREIKIISVEFIDGIQRDLEDLLNGS